LGGLAERTAPLNLGVVDARCTTRRRAELLGFSILRSDERCMV
jgi:hypothetical protein